MPRPKSVEVQSISNTCVPQNLLQPDETVLWVGSPSAWRFASLVLPSLVDVVIALILIGVGAFTILRIEKYTVIPIVAEMFAYLVIVAGVIQVLFAPAVGYLTALGILYVVTNQRLLVIDKRHDRLSKEFRRADLTLSATVVTDSGCVYFAEGPIETAAGKRRQIGFEHIDTPTEVAKLIDRTFRDQPATPG